MISPHGFLRLRDPDVLYLDGSDSGSYKFTVQVSVLRPQFLTVGLLPLAA